MENAEKHETSFVTKVVVVVLATAALLSYLTPNWDRLQRFDTPINKIYLLSFVGNPEALWIASEHWEEQKKYDNAIREMRLAIGLLELHNANASVIDRYRARLNDLKRKN
jgi:hypothetical protein